MALRVPEMELTQPEAHNLAVAIKRVERYYPSIARVLNAKVMDHSALATTLIQIYGSRLAAIKLRKASDNATVINPAETVATPGPGHPNYKPPHMA